jgi:hypothetical protein
LVSAMRSSRNEKALGFLSQGRCQRFVVSRLLTARLGPLFPQGGQKVQQKESEESHRFLAIATH